MTFSRVVILSLALGSFAHAEEHFKNLQLLKHASADDVDLAMDFMSSSLGVGCDFCHVTNEGGRWPMEKDDKMQKKVARKMITMADKINKDFFGGERVVTCVTCHQGRAEPADVPPMTMAFSEHRVEPSEVKAPTVTPQDVLAKYVQATGGKAAWEKLRSRNLKGKVQFAPNQDAPIEIAVAAPNKYAATVQSPRGAMKAIFDGKNGWHAGWFGVREMSSVDKADAARDAELAEPIRLETVMQGLKAMPDALINKQPMHVLEGRAYGASEQLFFDVKSGLLARRIARVPTPLGDLVEQIDYADWKPVDGVTLPFTVARNVAGRYQTEHFTSITHNGAVDDKAFVKPDAK